MLQTQPTDHSYEPYIYQDSP